MNEPNAVGDRCQTCIATIDPRSTWGADHPIHDKGSKWIGAHPFVPSAAASGEGSDRG